MSDIQDLLKETESCNESIRETEEAREQERKEAAERKQQLNKELKERVLAGESTGDRIADWVISAHGSLISEYHKAVLDLDRRIREHQGEPVLITEAESRFHGCTGFGYTPRLSEFSLDQTWKLGILNGELEIVLGESYWSFPTGSHVRWTSSSWRRGAELQEGDATAFWAGHFIHHLQEPVRSGREDHTPVKLAFVIGWEELDTFGDSPEGDLEQCSYSLRERGHEQHQEIRLVRSERLIELFSAGNWPIPDEMPKLRAYRDRKFSAKIQSAKDCLEKREELLLSIEGAVLHNQRTARKRESLQETLRTLRSLSVSFEKLRINGDIADEVRRVVGGLEKKKKAE